MFGTQGRDANYSVAGRYVTSAPPSHGRPSSATSTVSRFARTPPIFSVLGATASIDTHQRPSASSFKIHHNSPNPAIHVVANDHFITGKSYNKLYNRKIDILALGRIRWTPYGRFGTRTRFRSNATSALPSHGRFGRHLRPPITRTPIVRMAVLELELDFDRSVVPRGPRTSRLSTIAADHSRPLKMKTDCKTTADRTLPAHGGTNPIDLFFSDSLPPPQSPHQPRPWTLTRSRDTVVDTSSIPPPKSSASSVDADQITLKCVGGDGN